MNKQIDESPVNKGQRRRSSEIDAILRDFEFSGMSPADFAMQHGIRLATLRQWIYRRRAKACVAKEGASSSSGFVPVRIKPQADTSGSVIVRFSSGHEVTLPASLGMASLQSLTIALLKSC